jgi:leucyl aminopeptidase
MNSIFVARGTSDAIPIWFVTAANYPDVRERLDAAAALLPMRGFRAEGGPSSVAAGKEAGLAASCSGSKRATTPRIRFCPGRLPQQLLPDGVYRFANEPHDARLAALAFALGTYRFTRYRKAEPRDIKLDLPQSIDREDLDFIVEGVTLARDLINTPANDMGPAELEGAARSLATRMAPKFAPSSATIC